MYESDCCYSPFAFRHSRGFAVCDHKCTSMSENISIYIQSKSTTHDVQNLIIIRKKWERWCYSTFHLWVEFPQKLFVFACHFLGTLWRDDRLLLNSRWDRRRNVEDDFVGRHFTRNEETSSTHGQRWREMGESLWRQLLTRHSSTYRRRHTGRSFYSFLLSDFVCVGEWDQTPHPDILIESPTFRLLFLSCQERLVAFRVKHYNVKRRDRKEAASWTRRLKIQTNASKAHFTLTYPYRVVPPPHTMLLLPCPAAAVRAQWRFSITGLRSRHLAAVLSNIPSDYCVF